MSIFSGYDSYIYHGTRCEKHDQHIAKFSRLREVLDFAKWSRHRPVAQLIPRPFGWRPLLHAGAHVVRGELRCLLHRIGFLFKRLGSSGMCGPDVGLACEAVTDNRLDALQRLIGERPWTTLYDYDTFLRGWEASEEWAKRESFPGSCADCSFWEKELNGYGVCKYSEIIDLPHQGPTIKGALVTIGTFACTNFSKQKR